MKTGVLVCPALFTKPATSALELKQSGGRRHRSVSFLQLSQQVTATREQGVPVFHDQDDPSRYRQRIVASTNKSLEENILEEANTFSPLAGLNSVPLPLNTEAA